MSCAQQTSFKKLMAEGRQSVNFFVELLKFCFGKSEVRDWVE